MVFQVGDKANDNNILLQLFMPPFRNGSDELRYSKLLSVKAGGDIFALGCSVNISAWNVLNCGVEAAQWKPKQQWQQQERRVELEHWSIHLKSPTCQQSCQVRTARLALLCTVFLVHTYLQQILSNGRVRVLPACFRSNSPINESGNVSLSSPFHWSPACWSSTPILVYAFICVLYCYSSNIYAVNRHSSSSCQMKVMVKLMIIKSYSWPGTWLCNND